MIVPSIVQYDEMQKYKENKLIYDNQGKFTDYARPYNGNKLQCISHKLLHYLEGMAIHDSANKPAALLQSRNWRDPHNPKHF
jgi:hypothetical protein